MGQAVLVADVRMIDGMQQQVHRGNAHHGLVRIEAGELFAGECLPLFLGHLLVMVLSDGFRCGNKESRRAARRIAQVGTMDTTAWGGIRETYG
jgi:hypothetical protein